MVDDSTPVVIHLSDDAGGVDASSNQSKRFNYLVVRQSMHVKSSLS